MKQINLLVVKNDFSIDGITPEVMDQQSQHDAVNSVINMLNGINSGASDGSAYIGFMYNGTPSTATLTADTVVAGDTVTIGGVTLEADVDFAVGADDAETLNNCIAEFENRNLTDLVRLSFPTPTSCLMTSIYIQNLGYINTTATGGFSFGATEFEGFSDFGYKVCNLGLNVDPETIFLG